MARRADHSRAELTELVLNAATKIIAKEGLHGLATRKIALEIGYSAGTIYNIFNDLNAVISNVNARTLSKLGKAFSELDLVEDPLSNAKLLLSVYLKFGQDNPKLLSSIVQHSSRDDLDSLDSYTNELEGVFAMVEKALTPIFEANTTQSPRVAVRALWAALQGISALPASALVLTEGNESRSSLSEHLVETYLRGIQATP
jgi:AcrR family transcriptional regulator